MYVFNDIKKINFMKP